MNLFLGANYSLRINRTTSRSRGLAVSSFSSDIHDLICATFQGDRARVIQANTTTEMACRPTISAIRAASTLGETLDIGRIHQSKARLAQGTSNHVSAAALSSLSMKVSSRLSYSSSSITTGNRVSSTTMACFQWGGTWSGASPNVNQPEKGRGDLESVHLHAHGEPASCARPTRGRSDCGPRRPGPYLPS
jgi:hypothetical protein